MKLKKVEFQRKANSIEWVWNNGEQHQCNRCGDLENPHKSIECKGKFKCNNCDSNEHKTKEYHKC